MASRRATNDQDAGQALQDQDTAASSSDMPLYQKRTWIQWMFWFIEFGVSLLMIFLGALNWNDCDSISTLPVWCIIYGILFLILLVVTPCMRLYPSVFWNVKRLNQWTYFLGNQVLHFMAGYGAALILPNLVGDDSTVRDSCDSSLYYFCLYMVVASMVGIVLFALSPWCIHFMFGNQLTATTTTNSQTDTR